MPPLDLQFRVEIEVLTKDRSTRHPRWSAAAARLSECLRQDNLPNHVSPAVSTPLSRDGFVEWALMKVVLTEGPLGSHDSEDNEYGVRLASRMYGFQPRDAWHSDLKTVFDTLQTRFQTRKRDPLSAFQVHVSPRSRPWSLSEAKCIAQAVICYERAIDQLMPLDRRHSSWCNTNRENGVLGSLGLAAACSRIDATTSMRDLCGVICKAKRASELGRMLKKKEDFIDRNFRWNFMPLLFEKPMIEFRQPPAVDSNNESAKWILFTVCFVQHAVCNLLDIARMETLSNADLTNYLYTMIIRAANDLSVDNAAKRQLSTLFEGVLRGCRLVEKAPTSREVDALSKSFSMQPIHAALPRRQGPAEGTGPVCGDRESSTRDGAHGRGRGRHSPRSTGQSATREGNSPRRAEPSLGRGGDGQGRGKGQMTREAK